MDKWEKYRDKIPKIEGVRNKTLYYAMGVSGIDASILRELPLGYNTTTDFQILRLLGFKSISVGWKQCPEKIENALFLLFSPDWEILTQKFCFLYEYLVGLPTFYRVYYPDVGVIVIVLKPKEKYIPVLRAIKTGRYSSIGEKLALELYQRWDGRRSYKNTQYMIVVKDPEYRKKMEEDLNVIIPEENELDSRGTQEILDFPIKYEI